MTDAWRTKREGETSARGMRRERGRKEVGLGKETKFRVENVWRQAGLYAVRSSGSRLAILRSAGCEL